MPGGIDYEPKIHSSLRQCPSIHSSTQVGGQPGGVTMQWGRGGKGDIIFQYGLRAQALSAQKWVQGKSTMS